MQMAYGALIEHLQGALGCIPAVTAFVRTIYPKMDIGHPALSYQKVHPFPETFGAEFYD